MTALSPTLEPGRTPVIDVQPTISPQLAQPQPARPRHGTTPPKEARDIVECDDRGKWDVTVLRRSLAMKNGELDFPLDVGGEESVRDRLAPTRFALGQMCSRLGIPASYLRKCPLILQDQNFNFWLKEGVAREGGLRAAAPCPSNGGTDDSGPEVPDIWDDVPEPPVFGRAKPERNDDEKWLLRARHGTLRAALSEHYSPLDNAVLLDTLLPLLPESYQVQWIGLQDESFHLRLIDTFVPVSVLPGDDLFCGIHVANSEVGFRSITIDALVYRLVCTNGLIATIGGKSLLRRRHVHIAAPRFKAALEEALSQALSATEDLLFALGQSAKIAVPDPEEAIDRLARRWQFGESTAEIAKAALLAEPAGSQHTAYGLVNAFTHAAQSLPDERRYDLETLAGQLARGVDLKYALSKQELALGDRGASPEPGIVEYTQEKFDAEVMGRTTSVTNGGGRS